MVERMTLNHVVVGSIPTVGGFVNEMILLFCFILFCFVFFVSLDNEYKKNASVA